MTCVQSNAAALAVVRPEERYLFHYRKGYCELFGAVLTSNSDGFRAAAGDFSEAISNWPTKTLAGPPAGLLALVAIAHVEQGRAADSYLDLAKELDAKIVTNDFNLNKVAQLRGAEVLNINELANALKPVYLPGETMKVFILKEGKEFNQGIAYLDDGTMVVVDNARKMIGKTVESSVTSVRQTTAGKMIFGRYEERRGELSHHSREERQERNDRDPRPADRAPVPERQAPTEVSH
jgi:hypothetical protein